ncbi:hypothetical protein Rhe02_75660 [Rhizocola hellebori]|uniref:High-affinity nickel-transporter n=1 Tax=Rhizocola hellebori TaxID=1392758 RepID=A0A8J3QH24_9ACTN|nr:hypothetical protein [Rhizocola hellebori]GIH09499.1 hypothetical protein Rhe02_75660 [Rhizocola hellebori]
MIGLVLGATMALLPAHPLGNFSVNQLVSLTLHPDRVEAVAVVDLAELPSLQLKPACAEISAQLTVKVDGRPLRWTLGSADVARNPGAAGLETTHVTCHLSAPATLDRPASLDVVNTYLPDRLGWHEMTATGVGLQVTGLPSASATDQLRTYPEDLLSSPPDVRYAHLTGQPGTSAYAPTAQAAGTQPGIFARAESWLQNTVGDRTLTPLVGLLAVLLAMVLGAGHALLPGHGKTVMAIYLAGRAGRPRDALLVGATVTATHTGGVLALGLLLTGASSLAGESVLGWLGIASGTLVTAVGLAMLITALRHRRRTRHHHAPHHHAPHDHAVHHHAPHDHAPHDHAVHHQAAHRQAGGEHVTHDHAAHRHAGRPHHHHGHFHRHDGGGVFGKGHRHDPVDGGAGGVRKRRFALAALGIAGGLVPSPSALIVLLGAIALGRTGFGIMLVLAYGLGMAATLTAAGLVLLKVRDRISHRFQVLTRLAPAAPYATGALVLVVGFGLAARAATLVV